MKLYLLPVLLHPCVLQLSLRISPRNANQRMIVQWTQVSFRHAKSTVCMISFFFFFEKSRCFAAKRNRKKTFFFWRFFLFQLDFTFSSKKQKGDHLKSKKIFWRNFMGSPLISTLEISQTEGGASLRGDIVWFPMTRKYRRHFCKKCGIQVKFRISPKF